MSENIKVINPAERAKLAEALKNGASREEIVSGMMKTYCGKEYGKQHWYSGLNDTWASPGGKPASEWDKLLALGNGLEQLALDFGFMTHLPEFLMLAQEGKVKTDNWQEARESLKQQLGYKELWRGMLLSGRELEEIRKNGIKSKLISPDARDEPIKLLEEKLEMGQSNVIDKHFCNESFFLSPFISLTTHKDLAFAVARKYGDHSIKSLVDWKNIYLFKVKVPEIDVLYYTKHCLRKPSYFERFGERTPEVVVYNLTSPVLIFS